MRTVLMILFDDVQSLDVTGPIEVFTGANTWRAGRGEDPAYDVRTASLGGHAVRTSSGLHVTPDADLREYRTAYPDLLIVPGGHSRTMAWCLWCCRDGSRFAAAPAASRPLRLPAATAR